MKYLKSYNESRDSIESICNQYAIRNYTINDDGSIDVDGDVLLCNKSLKKLPIRFNYVSGSFNCIDNKLVTLEGSPREVGEGFYCQSNELTSLKYCPENVGNFSCYNNKLSSLKWSPKQVRGSYVCHSNKLTSLQFSPREVGGCFNCKNNQLQTLEFGPERVGGYFECCNNNITTLKYLPKELGKLYCHNNPLPNQILDNISDIDIICQEAEDFSIWRKDGTLDERRFKYMLEILKEEGKI